MTTWKQRADDLVRLLRLRFAPVAISFGERAPEGVEPFDDPMPDPTPDGRTGRVPAGCVFWTLAADRTFTTAPEDHGNCSVGSLTHGLIDLSEAAGRADVAALVEAGWVTEDVFPHIPTMSSRPATITYGPLDQTPVDPDVVFLRLNGKQLMELHSAWPDMAFEGKPQCHIIPMAAEGGQVAASVGCAISRVRTGMGSDELTCAIPAGRLDDMLDRLEGIREADAHVETYAAEDKRRFS